MLKKFNHYWRIFWRFRQTALMRQMEHRGDFFFWVIVSSMWTVFNFFFFALIVQVKNGIGSWSLYEVYVLLSMYTMLDAFTWSFFSLNMSDYTKAIFSGTFDTILQRPVDTQFLVMVQHNSYANVFRFLMGFAMLLWSLRQLNLQPSVLDWGLFVILFTCSLILIYSIWFFFSTFAFWVERLNNINEIVPSLRRVWMAPREVYHGFLGILITIVLPIGLASSIPSEALILRNHLGWIGYFIMATVLAVLISRAFFKYSITKYVGAGS